ncbi:MAG: hypothetical protein JW760_14335 [Spirochaetales bacterium]|nr:hypothetical protein [Spirochaetales bacterium]
MTAGEDFLRRCEKARKGDPSGYRDGMRKAFFTSLPFCPEELLEDLLEELEDLSGSGEKELEEILSAVIDLMTGDKQGKETPLRDRELTAVYQGVNDYAQQLPEDLVFQVMRTAVERGLLG